MSKPQMNNHDHEGQLATSPALGCLEIGLFMRDGFQRFEVNRQTFWRSFLILGIGLLITLASAPYFYTAKSEMLSVSLNMATLLLGLQAILATATCLSFIYVFCHAIDRKPNFISLVTISNWATLIPLVCYLPVFLLLVMETRTYDDVYPVLVGLSVYAYALTAYLVRHILDIPWELAVFVAICTMAINEFLIDLFYLIAG